MTGLSADRSRRQADGFAPKPRDAMTVLNGSRQILDSDESGARRVRHGNLFHRKFSGNPGIEPALQRTHARDASLLQLQRHPGAGCFVGSSAVEDDVAVARNLLVAHLQLFGRKAKRAGNLHGVIV